MKRVYEESERPSEWLRSLRENAEAYSDLLRDAGETATAAYRIAAARCRTYETPSPIPTLREVHAAAVELCSATNQTTPVPSRTALAEACGHSGLALIGA